MVLIFFSKSESVVLGIMVITKKGVHGTNVKLN